MHAAALPPISSHAFRANTRAEALDSSDYTIDLYRPEQIDGVVALLSRELWPGTASENFAYFKWKFHDNPYAARPLGVVARHGEAIVGFRGYFATEWYLGGKDKAVTVLIPGDTVVCADHRRKGLSVTMGRLAMERFAPICRVLLNTTASKNSLPGYLRMGFVPLYNKAYHKRCTLFRDVVSVARGALGLKKVPTAGPIEKAVGLGDFGAISVSADAKPHDMAHVLSGGENKTTGIALRQDETFFRWRYSNPKGRYAHYISKSGGRALGYLVLRISDDCEEGFILDYAERENGQIANILSHISTRDRIAELNILNTSLEGSMADMLKAQGFKRWDLQSWVKNRVYGYRPVMVRPVEPECSEADWFLEGLDIRDIENWHYKEICQDST